MAHVPQHACFDNLLLRFSLLPTLAAGSCCPLLLRPSRALQDNGVSPSADYKAPDSHLFWQAGLDGKGQVIGIGDSGIDMNSCYFRDPANPFNPSPDSKEWISPNHRKVVYYYGIADTTFRDQVGHGTHTSGTLVGEDPADPTSKATGAAKGAKVAFVDISMQPTQVNAPQELDTEYFPKMYAQGARIFSGELAGVGVCSGILNHGRRRR